MAAALMMAAASVSSWSVCSQHTANLILIEEESRGKIGDRTDKIYTTLTSLARAPIVSMLTMNCYYCLLVTIVTVHVTTTHYCTSCYMHHFRVYLGGGWLSSSCSKYLADTTASPLARHSPTILSTNCWSSAREPLDCSSLR